MEEEHGLLHGVASQKCGFAALKIKALTTIRLLRQVIRDTRKPDLTKNRSSINKLDPIDTNLITLDITAFVFLTL